MVFKLLGCLHLRTPKFWKFVATMNKPIYGLAFRTGRGKVVLGHTSFPLAGPGKWTYVPRYKVSDVPPAPTTYVGLQYFETKVVQLTVGQSSPEWFLLRKFRVTGTVAGTVFRGIGREILKSPEYAYDRLVNFVLDTLFIKNLPIFFDNNNDAFHLEMETVKVYGLMYRVGCPYAAFSPDAICTDC
jgi:hypothetical protein